MNIQISISDQSLSVFDENNRVKKFSISTAKNGVGEEMDSECTPRGKHIITEKIGDGYEVNSVFVGRIATGEIYEQKLREQYPERDWILTRILWLTGTEEGKNKGQYDGKRICSHDRYIYIHGTPDDVPMGKPGSRGCVRMKNSDVIEIFDLVDFGTEVNICE